MKPSLLPLLFLLSAFFYGCGQKASAPPEAESTPAAPLAATASQNTLPFNLPGALKAKNRDFPAENRLRKEWYEENTLVKYVKLNGDSSPGFVEATNAFSKWLTMRLSGSPLIQAGQVTPLAAAAVKAGSTDPLLRYLAVRYLPEGSIGTNELKAAYREIVDGLFDYHAMFSFYPALRGAALLNDRELTPEHPFVVSAKKSFFQATSDRSLPPQDVYEMTSQYFDLLKRLEPNPDKAWLQIEPHLMQHWPKTAEIQLVKGRAYIDSAWKARGSGLANTVSPQGWVKFEADLEIAEAALEKCWDLDGGNVWAATEMLTVELGQGKGRERMELWFDRAISMDPNNHDAAQRKLNYLSPKWYGDELEMRQFGRECIMNPKFGPALATVMIHVHSQLEAYHEEETDYFKQEHVWLDIRDTYDTAIRRWPMVSRNLEYAYYASRCGKDEIALQLIAQAPKSMYGRFRNAEGLAQFKAQVEENLRRRGKL
ncbi:MAG: hypothetical protein SFY81_14990 [Verrucomicrobiota bacterium]|nr:hypothetical protein [Verrucomicrobiota bacterium]